MRTGAHTRHSRQMETRTLTHAHMLHSYKLTASPSLLQLTTLHMRQIHAHGRHYTALYRYTSATSFYQVAMRDDGGCLPASEGGEWTSPAPLPSPPSLPASHIHTPTHASSSPPPPFYPLPMRTCSLVLVRTTACTSYQSIKRCTTRPVVCVQSQHGGHHLCRHGQLHTVHSHTVHTRARDRQCYAPPQQDHLATG
jgi:hypothetical protein